MQVMRGVGVSPGIAIGKALVLKEETISIPQQRTQTAAEEIQHLNQSLISVRDKLEEIKARAFGDLGDKAKIIDVQILITQDEELLSYAQQCIQDGMTAEAAINAGIEFYAKMLEELDNEYMRERVADLRDVGGRIVRNLLGVDERDLANLSEDIIIVAKDLSPSDTASMNKAHVLGFITDIGGRTSHSAIMARSLEIPAIVGTKDGTRQIQTGDILIVDAVEGEIMLHPTSSQISQYERRREVQWEEKQRLQSLKSLPSILADGYRVELSANIGNPEDAKGAIANGAEGVGLYRTEFLYMGRNEFPSEEEQFAAYKAVAVMFDQNRPVVIRTLDIGGDKELPYLDMPKEMNPFLGYRAIRLCLDRTEIFKIQLRAILRASAFGNIKLMYPMISTLEELRAANQVLDAVKKDLRRENVPFNEEMEVGIMVEIPAVAVLADQFAKEVDFFSIGTNDLVQYTMAADRMNEKVAYLYQPFNPAVLRLIQGVIKAAHQEGKWVGMCGEMAGDLSAIPILLGLGLDELSMSASSILPARSLVRLLTQQEARRITKAALALGNAQEIKNFVEQEMTRIR